MTAVEIIKTLRALLLTGDHYDFKEACRIFNSIDDDVVFEQVYVRMKGLINYDANGNYAGTYYRENGWTA